MLYSMKTMLFACMVATGFAHAADGGREMEAAQPTRSNGFAIETETPTLQQSFSATLVMTEPVVGIVAVELASHARTSIRPINPGRPAVHRLSEPDEAGCAIFVAGAVSGERCYTAQTGTGDKKQVLFLGPGDPLWDYAISLISLAPIGGNAALGAQPPENEGKKFRPLLRGPHRLWESAMEATRDLGVTAICERPAWFPHGRRFAHAAAEVAAGSSGSESLEQVVGVIDTDTGENRPLASSYVPLVSSDGCSVRVTAQ